MEEDMQTLILILQEKTKDPVKIATAINILKSEWRG